MITLIPLEFGGAVPSGPTPLKVILDEARAAGHTFSNTFELHSSHLFPPDFWIARLQESRNYFSGPDAATAAGPPGAHT
jgi:hypothetical protein